MVWLNGSRGARWFFDLISNLVGMHLWRILSALLYDQRLPLTYEGEPAGRRDGPPKPLDAIDPKLVGSLATKQLFGYAARGGGTGGSCG